MKNIFKSATKRAMIIHGFLICLGICSIIIGEISIGIYFVIFNLMFFLLYLHSLKSTYNTAISNFHITENKLSSHDSICEKCLSKDCMNCERRKAMLIICKSLNENWKTL